MRFTAKSVVVATLLLVLVALAGCGQPRPASGCGGLTATDAWATPRHAGSHDMLAYLKLHNTGSRDVVVEAVSSSQFDRAELRQRAAGVGTGSANTATQSHTRSGSRPLGAFTVAAGKTFELAPNEREIALYAPTQAYRTGDQVELTLTCGRDHATLNVPAIVRGGDDASIGPPPADADTARTEKALRSGHDAAAAAGANDDSKTAH